MKDYEFRIYLHRKLCDMADLLIYYYNPCGWECGHCKANKTCCHLHQLKTGDGLCDFLDEGRCNLPNIKCKTWFCDQVSLPAPLQESLNSLISIAKEYGMYE